MAQVLAAPPPDRCCTAKSNASISVSVHFVREMHVNSQFGSVLRLRYTMRALGTARICLAAQYLQSEHRRTESAYSTALHSSVSASSAVREVRRY
eukprot:1757913-Rhodomonas_salina.1